MAHHDVNRGDKPACISICQTQPKLLQILRRINVNCRINVNTIDSNDHGVGDNVYVTKM